MKYSILTAILVSAFTMGINSSPVVAAEADDATLFDYSQCAGTPYKDDDGKVYPYNHERSCKKGDKPESCYTNVTGVGVQFWNCVCEEFTSSSGAKKYSVVCTEDVLAMSKDMTGM